MDINELVKLLDPAPERLRKVCKELLAILDPEHIEQLRRQANPPRPADIAAMAKAVEDNCRQLIDSTNALGSAIEEVARRLPLTLSKDAVCLAELRAAVAQVERFERLAARIREQEDAKESRHAVYVKAYREEVVFELLTLFYRDHCSRWEVGHKKWQEELNKFLHAALEEVELDCDRRILEKARLRILTEFVEADVGSIADPGI